MTASYSPSVVNDEKALKGSTLPSSLLLYEELLQSEIFGHEKGAFTGATRLKHGLFEVADGGTVLLDEVGEASPEVQARLLRVLETGRFRRVGGTKDIRVSVHDGRVYHDNLTIRVDDLVIRTRGSVGLDQSLDLAAHVPIQRSWIADDRMATGLGGEAPRGADGQE